MAKQVLTFGEEPEIIAKIKASVEARQKTSRDFTFSEWMREAVDGKIASEKGAAFEKDQKAEKASGIERAKSNRRIPRGKPSGGASSGHGTVAL